eukprot:6186858-Pleurochrysis_carterae.AAC.1
MDTSQSEIELSAYEHVNRNTMMIVQFTKNTLVRFQSRSGICKTYGDNPHQQKPHNPFNSQHRRGARSKFQNVNHDPSRLTRYGSTTSLELVVWCLDKCTPLRYYSAQ